MSSALNTSVKPVPKSDAKTYRQYNKYIPYFFLSPFFLLFVLFGLFPIVFSFVISFADWNGLSPIKWVGIQNYTFLMNDAIFIGSLKNTALIIIYFLPPLVILGLAMSYVLHMGMIKGKDFFQTIIFLPYITTPIAIGLLFGVLFDSYYGLFNQLLLQLKLIAEPVLWLTDPVYSKPLIAFIMNWKLLGYVMILLMAGLKTIPKDIMESAFIDGAGMMTCFRKITLPLLKPILTFIIVTCVIGGFQLFDEPLLLFQSGGAGSVSIGGPERSGMTVIMYLYQTAFIHSKWGYAAAIGFVHAAIIFVISMIVLAILARKGLRNR
jgi:cellobiose transport system permease protein